MHMQKAKVPELDLQSFDLVEQELQTPNKKKRITIQYTKATKPADNDKIQFNFQYYKTKNVYNRISL